jgi:penicillin-binding protein 1A
MEEEGYITAKQAQDALDSKLAIKASKPKRLERKAGYFVEYIQKKLPLYVS